MWTDCYRSGINRVSCILSDTVCPEDTPTPAAGDPSCLSTAYVLRLGTESHQLAYHGVLMPSLRLPHQLQILLHALT